MLRPNLLPIDIISNKRSLFLRLAAGLAMTLLSGCGTWIHDNIPDGDLGGTVSVDWTEEDRFIYRPRNNDGLWFKPSFMSSRITPTEMYTDGGSVPRVFWNIPGLSPWALGPAYVIHDYIFLVHRCRLPDPEVAKLSFEDSALVLAEVGKSLIAHKLVKHDALDAIVWAVRTQYARDLWDKPGTVEDCKPPPRAFARGAIRRVMEFKIPPRAR